MNCVTCNLPPQELASVCSGSGSCRHEYDWRRRVAGMMSQVEPFPPPRPVGRCLVPPGGRLFKHWNQLSHGRLVGLTELSYGVARYEDQEIRAIMAWGP
jgi:hypothetical protein